MALSPYLNKYATNKATGEVVKVQYDNHAGGLYVEFVSDAMRKSRTWFRVTDLEDYRDYAQAEG